MKFGLIACFIGAIVSLPSHAQDNQGVILTGIPIVQNSGTLLINGKTIRLWGINTLAPDQQCWQENIAWCCGERATMALRHFIQGRTITCKTMKESTNNEPTSAVCTRRKLFHKKDLAMHLIKRGLATENKDESKGAYKKAEKKARQNHEGIWSGRFQTASDWKNGVEKYVEE